MVTKNLKNLELELSVNRNITLKILVEENVSDSYVGWLNDYEVTKYTEQNYYKHTFDTVRNFVNQKYYSHNDLLFGIFFKGIHVGNIKLGPIKFEHMSADISYFIGEKNFWGKGIASLCVKSIVKFAVNELDMKKISAGYYENNIGSEKVLAKCGFSVEGICQSSVIFENKRINSIIVGYVP